MLETINKMVWGDFLLFLLLGTGLMLSIRFKFFQIFKIRYIFKNTVLTLFNKKTQSILPIKKVFPSFRHLQLLLLLQWVRETS